MSINNILAGASLFEAQANEESEEEKKETATQAVQIYRLVTRIAQLFRDQTNTAYAHIQVADHGEVVRVEGGPFQNLVRRAFFEETDNIASTEALKSAIGLAAADARSEGETYPLSNRVAQKDAKLYYDLGDGTSQITRLSYSFDIATRRFRLNQ
jgi:hypothetical protein